MTKYLALLLALACTHGPRIGDRRLAVSEVPKYLMEASDGESEAEFFVKTLPDGRNLYEVKYPKGRGEVSKTFEADGTFFEKEEDISFTGLPAGPRALIKGHLDANYPGHRVLEVELRQTREKKYIDVEIRHPSGPSGYWEVSFNEEGRYVGREVEDFETPMTHN